VRTKRRLSARGLDPDGASANAMRWPGDKARCGIARLAVPMPRRPQLFRRRTITAWPGTRREGNRACPEYDKPRTIRINCLIPKSRSSPGAPSRNKQEPTIAAGTFTPTADIFAADWALTAFSGGPKSRQRRPRHQRRSRRPRPRRGDACGNGKPPQARGAMIPGRVRGKACAAFCRPRPLPTVARARQRNRRSDRQRAR
jgi:hypothetical protein